MKIKRKHLKALLVAVKDALELTGLECNCGEKCEGTCTYSEVKRAAKVVSDKLDGPFCPCGFLSREAVLVPYESVSMSAGSHRPNHAAWTYC